MAKMQKYYLKKYKKLTTTIFCPDFDRNFIPKFYMLERAQHTHSRHHSQFMGGGGKFLKDFEEGGLQLFIN